MVSNYLAHNLPLTLLEVPLRDSSSTDSCDLPQSCSIRSVFDPLVHPNLQVLTSFGQTLASVRGTGSTPGSSSLGLGALPSSAWYAPKDQLASLLAPPLSHDHFNTSFEEADLKLISSGINVQDSGSTAVLCHVGGNSVTAAWVGDSRAVIGRRRNRGRSSSTSSQDSSPDWLNDGGESWGSSSSMGSWEFEQDQCWEAIPLTNDHKPDRGDEMVSLKQGRGGATAGTVLHLSLMDLGDRDEKFVMCLVDVQVVRITASSVVLWTGTRCLLKWCMQLLPVHVRHPAP